MYHGPSIPVLDIEEEKVLQPFDVRMVFIAEFRVLEEEDVRVLMQRSDWACDGRIGVLCFVSWRVDVVCDDEAGLNVDDLLIVTFRCLSTSVLGSFCCGREWTRVSRNVLRNPYPCT